MQALIQKIANVLIKNRDYRSEATHFINDLKRARPELDAQQRAGRQLLWDKSLDRALLLDAQAARVKNKAYVYSTNP